MHWSSVLFYIRVLVLLTRKKPLHKLMTLLGLGIWSWKLFLFIFFFIFARLIDHEEPGNMHMEVDGVRGSWMYE
jgi:hypothetical protein